MPFEPVTSHFTRRVLSWAGRGGPYPTQVQIRELAVAGAFEITPAVHADGRGAFLEWFRATASRRPPVTG